jgi:hypothetical protein
MESSGNDYMSQEYHIHPSEDYSLPPQSEQSDDDACYLAGLKNDVHFIKFLSRIAKAAIAWLLEFNLGFPRFDDSTRMRLYSKQQPRLRPHLPRTTALRLINASQGTVT